jgi:hypothetical protein
MWPGGRNAQRSRRFFAFVLNLVLKNEVFGQQLCGGALVTYLIIFIPLLSLIGRSAKVTDDRLSG